MMMQDDTDNLQEKDVVPVGSTNLKGISLRRKAYPYAY